MLALGVAGAEMNEKDGLRLCEEHVLDASSQKRASLTGVRFAVSHRGLPMDILVCVFDVHGVKVAESKRHMVDGDLFTPRFSLPSGEYATVTQAMSPDGQALVGGGHTADLRTCPAGSFVAPSNTHRPEAGGYGITVVAGFCLPIDPLDARNGIGTDVTERQKSSLASVG